ncbi:class I SAM-dependent methyltransferase [Enemella sp. A6]|uniref:class I SAM-dependent methyltransferase n=1 Tax=Enemella sp. A6 TaxID=3440152 RepID=UPI003EB8C46C
MAARPVTTTTFRPEVVDWLVPHNRSLVLDLGSGTGSFARVLHARGDHVFGLDANPGRITRLAARIPTGRHVAGHAESLPFATRSFETVTAISTLHLFAPGLLFSEVARVLKPGGHFAVSYTVRDDTVPWVKRFASLVRSLDDTAMRGDFGQDSVRSLRESQYFSDVTERGFRTWVEVTREQLIAMVVSRPAIGGTEREAEAIEAVGAVYDEVARPPEPLQLPYRTICWRAQVDPAQQPAPEDSEVLHFRL